MGQTRPPAPNEPAGLDTGLHGPARREERSRGQGLFIAAVSAGGALGAGARYGAALLWPTAAGAFPWTTLVVNAVGCALIGVLMVVTEAWSAHHLVRPFLGTGVLGGFTTFSTYAVDTQQLVDGGSPRTGLAYLVLTLLVAMVAVWGAVLVTRRVVRYTALGGAAAGGQP